MQSSENSTFLLSNMLQGQNIKTSSIKKYFYKVIEKDLLSDYTIYL